MNKNEIKEHIEILKRDLILFKKENNQDMINYINKKIIEYQEKLIKEMI